MRFLSLLLLCWLLFPGLSLAINPLKITMPGKVAQLHAKYEDDCDQCHKAWRGVDSDRCLKCHEPLAKAIQSKRGLHRGPVGTLEGKPVYEWHGIPIDTREAPNHGPCRLCHPDHKGREFKMIQLSQFNPKQFDHGVTGFQLDGKHAEAECKDCHQLEGEKPTYLDLQQDCIACHEKDDTEQGHQGTLGKGCETCHNSTAFTPSSFDVERHQQTDFPLEAKHQEVECGDCHTDKTFKDTAQDCFSCHQKDDPHKGQLGKKCESCHSPKNWKSTSFGLKRHERTRFPLRGQHAEVECAKCHLDRKYKELATDCFACHGTTDQRNGHQGQLGKKCESCHTVQGWAKHSFTLERHNELNFALAGQHAEVECAKCHLDRKYKELATDCFTCHGTTDQQKGHQGQLGKKCESCHTVQGWAKHSFTLERHNELNFALVGQHAEVECAKCHLDRKYKGLATDCFTCHGTTDQQKGHQGQLGEQCESCHSVQGWPEHSFSRQRHNQLNFKLKGKHAEVECAKCHLDRKYKGIGTRCVDCHGSSS